MKPLSLLPLLLLLGGCHKPDHLKITLDPDAYIVSGPGSRKAIYSGKGELIAVIENQKEK